MHVAPSSLRFLQLPATIPISGRPAQVDSHPSRRNTVGKTFRNVTLQQKARAMAAPPSVPQQAGPRQMLQLEDYILPRWADALSAHAPKQRYALGIFPTPLHRWHPPGVPEGVEMYIKRDDLSGMQLSGNKVRKLEFLLAEALDQGHDCVITIGGIQSNHCRATAVAARYLGLESHLILRTSRELADSDPGLTGNLLLARMVGAHIHTVTKEEYTRTGSEALLQQLSDQLSSQGKKPYSIPVGGSNSLGCWGYLEAIKELEGQVADLEITDIALACGSGGTAAGMALGLHLSGLGCKLHAMGVCDDPEYFYNYMDGLLEGMGATKGTIGASSRQLVRMVQAKGAGYALSKQQELETMQRVAHATGIILDPVYSGKAYHTLLEEMQRQPEQWKGSKVLYLHTGGLFGMYDKVSQLQPMLQKMDKADRLLVS